MSDYLAVGGVSAVLLSLLSAELSTTGPTSILGTPPDLTNVAPDLISTGADEKPGINIFMYYASFNPALRNLDLPSSSASGARLSNPPLAINLHYLVTAYGSKAFDAEILIAWAMRVFHNTPVVPPSVIADALSALTNAVPASPEQSLVATSTLASQIEHIRITPESLTTEEIYRLWTAFQTHYRPTTSYQVSVVVIQDKKDYTSNLPVQQRSVVALPLVSPVIEAVTPAMATSGQTLTLTGRNFLGDIAADTQVSFDGDPPIAASTVQDTAVRVVTPATMLAGVHTVRVRRLVVFPSSPRPHSAFSSNPIPFQVIPTITPPAVPPITAKQGTPCALIINPAVGSLQTVLVYIGDQAIPVDPRPATNPPSTTITVNIPSGFPAGTYPLRIEVDGAQSKIAQDTNPASPTFGQWLPQVEVTI